MKIRKSRLYLFPVLLAVVVSGCATGGQKQTAGTVIGGAAGALVGAQFGSGTGQVVGAAIGAVGGALGGNMIGKQLDDKDKLEAASKKKSS